MQRARVLLADDHALVAEGLRRILESEFDVIGAAADGMAVVREALRLRPDVVVLGISLPLLSGLEAARQIKRAVPTIRIVFLTMHSDLSYLQDAIRLGASGYLLKRSAGKEVVKALREVLRGRVYVAPQLTADIDDPRLRKALERGLTSSLTARQREILRLVAAGRSNAEIASRLNITAKTVRFHRAAIARKLGISSTAELTRYALQHGLVSG